MTLSGHYISGQMEEEELVLLLLLMESQRGPDWNSHGFGSDSTSVILGSPLFPSNRIVVKGNV